MNGRPWTASEISYLRQHYGKVSIHRIAGFLSRTWRSVYQKAGKIGLAFDRRAELGPEFESFLLRQNADGFSDADIAAKWGANVGTIGKHRRRLQLPSTRNNHR